jgi:ABC-type phosphate transport system substrate-binding protein
MTFYKHFSPLLAVVLALYSFSSVAQSQEKIVVVTNLNNDVQVLDKKGIIDLFMGKYSAFPNGRQATPIDIELNDELKGQFYKSLVGLPLARVNAYWSRLKFSGRVKPPSIEQTMEDVKQRLEDDESALAYVYESYVTDKMKVVYRFD